MIILISRPLIALSLLVAAGSASATDRSGDLMHYLGHEGYLNTWPTVSATLGDDGVATVTGHVDSQIERRRVEQVVAAAPGVIEVRNLILTD